MRDLDDLAAGQSGGAHLPPQQRFAKLRNEELEQGFLASAIWGVWGSIDELAEYVKPEHFWDPLHQRIWDAAVKSSENGQVMTLEGLQRLLSLTGQGDMDYLAALSASVCGINPKQYIKSLRDLHLRREMFALGADIQDVALVEDPTKDAAARLEQAEVMLYHLGERGPDKAHSGTLRDARREADEMIERAQKAVNGISGIPSGIKDLDQRLGGFREKELVVLAGRPAMGKTAMALTLAVAAAKSGKRVKVASLEMSMGQLYQRLYAQYTGISVQEQLRSGLPLAKHRQLAEAANEINRLPIIVDDYDTQTVSYIRNGARREKRRDGLDMLIVDYLGLIKPSDARMQKVHQIEEITTGLKRLAKELAIPIILLSQLSWSVEQRDDKRPTLSDLRDSGAIEQDADVVMFLYRPEYYLARSEPEDQQKWAAWRAQLDAAKGRAEVITAKFRQGEVGTDTVSFDGARQIFSILPEAGDWE